MICLLPRFMPMKHLPVAGVDLERAVLGKDVGQTISFDVERDETPIPLSLMLDVAPRNALVSESNRYWKSLGMKLVPVTPEKLHRMGSPYNGGLQVSAIRPEGPAARQGIRSGDVLVGMHKWETLSLDNINYVLGQPEIKRSGRVKFYVVRSGETLFGHLPMLR